jgi:S-adenosyl methyltransferase
MSKGGSEGDVAPQGEGGPLLDASWVASGVDVTVAHPARRYDYWLGGKDHFAADRESGDAVAAAFPTIRTAAVENRLFLGRAVHYLAAEAGIDQFLDIGTGIPAADNTHEVAQAINPAARVVYVDNDPVVLAHARALLTSTPEGATTCLQADLRDPDGILGDPAVAAMLDLRRPVALMLVAVLHFILEEDRPLDLVRQLVAALPAGSYLVLSHATSDHMPAEVSAGVNAADAATRVPFQFRSRDQFAGFFEGHELVPPGIVSVADWRAEQAPAPRPSAAETAVYGAVARIA